MDKKYNNETIDADFVEFSVQRDERPHFIRDLHSTIKMAYVTRVLLGLNIAVYVLMLIDGTNFMEPQDDKLLKWGSSLYYLTVGGEPWRLLSCTFIHIGLVHLLFNMWALKAIGHFVERIYGHYFFAFIYLVSALGASINSLWWHQDNFAISAGASGAVFGIFGAIPAFIFLQKKAIPAEFYLKLRNNVLFVIGVNLALGMSMKGIDNSAHMGGLACGFLCGLILSRSVNKRKRNRYTWAKGILHFVVVVPLLFFFWEALPKGDGVYFRQRDIWIEKETKILERQQELFKSFYESQDDKILLGIDEEIVQAWREIELELQAITLSEKSPFLEEKKRFESYFSLRAAFVEAWLDAQGKPSPAAEKKLAEIYRKLTELLKPSE